MPQLPLSPLLLFVRLRALHFLRCPFPTIFDGWTASVSLRFEARCYFMRNGELENTEVHSVAGVRSHRVRRPLSFTLDLHSSISLPPSRLVSLSDFPFPHRLDSFLSGEDNSS